MVTINNRHFELKEWKRNPVVEDYSCDHCVCSSEDSATTKELCVNHNCYIDKDGEEVSAYFVEVEKDA